MHRSVVAWPKGSELPHDEAGERQTMAAWKKKWETCEILSDSAANTTTGTNAVAAALIQEIITITTKNRLEEGQ